MQEGAEYVLIHIFTVPNRLKSEEDIFEVVFGKGINISEVLIK